MLFILVVKQHRLQSFGAINQCQLNNEPNGAKVGAKVEDVLTWCVQG